MAPYRHLLLGAGLGALLVPAAAEEEPLDFNKDVRPSATGDAAAVLAAKAQGVSIRKINDVARMSDQSPPVPFDPKLPASE